MKKANGLTRGMAALALCLIATVPAACAASSSGGADPQGFTLTDGFLAKYQAAELDIAKDPCRLGFVKFMGMGMAGANGGDMSLQQAATRYDAQPGVHDMLQRHGLTAGEMLTGAATLLRAGLQDTHAASGGTPVSAANMAFYRSHKDAIHQFAMQVGQQQLRANGGKMPECLR